MKTLKTFLTTTLAAVTLLLSLNTRAAMVFSPADYSVYAGGWCDPNGLPRIGTDLLLSGTVNWLPSTRYQNTFALSPGGEGRDWNPPIGAIPPPPEALNPPGPVFSATISCQLVVSDSGTYTFGTESDDGSALFIDGALVVNNGGLHFDRTIFSSTFLTAGPHDLLITYFENGWDGNILTGYAAENGVPSVFPGPPPAVPESSTFLTGAFLLLPLALHRLRALKPHPTPA